MATANLNKSEEFLTNTTAVSKYIPRRLRISKKLNLPFQAKIYLWKIPLNGNIVRQDLLHRLGNSQKGGFWLMQILGRLGVRCSISLELFTFIQIGSVHTVMD